MATQTGSVSPETKHISQKNYTIGQDKIAYVGEPLIIFKDYLVLESGAMLQASNSFTIAGGLLDVAVNVSGSQEQKFSIVGSIDVEGVKCNAIEIPGSRLVFGIKPDGTFSGVAASFDYWTSPIKGPNIYTITPPDTRFVLCKMQRALEGVPYTNIELIYSGLSDSTIHLLYREYTLDNLIRPSFTQELLYPSSAETIRFQNFKISVNSVSGEKIIYSVLEDKEGLAKEFRPKSGSNNNSIEDTTKPKQGEKVASSGTGFFVSSDGYLVTSFHVVEGTSQITVRDANGSEYPAKLVKSDPKNDVALLKVQCAAKPIPVAPYVNVSKGDEVFTIGYPLPELQGQEQKATFGRVNALTGIKDDIRFVQVDVPVQPGNSGGPLIDRNGRVVGMVTHILAQVETLIVSGTLPQNVNYALKSDYIMPVIRPYVNPINNQEKQDTANIQISEIVKKVEPSVVLVIAK